MEKQGVGGKHACKNWSNQNQFHVNVSPGFDNAQKLHKMWSLREVG